MARAMRLGVEAGRLAFQAGRIPKKLYATASSPLDGLSLHLKYICFERAWPEIMRCTPPTDIDALVKWGRANLSQANFYRDYVAPPDDVRAAWHQAWRN